MASQSSCSSGGRPTALVNDVDERFPPFDAEKFPLRTLGLLLGGPGAAINGIISTVTMVTATVRALASLLITSPGPPSARPRP